MAFSSCAVQASRVMACSVSCPVVQDLSSLNSDRTHVPCIGWQILYHWTAREVSSSFSRFFNKPNYTFNLPKRHDVVESFPWAPALIFNLVFQRGEWKGFTDERLGFTTGLPPKLDLLRHLEIVSVGWKENRIISLKFSAVSEFLHHHSRR